MALSENGGGMYMPVAPAYGGGFGGGNGGFGSDGWWIILLFLVFGGAWGRGGFGGGGGMGGGGDLYPWINNSEHISDGIWRFSSFRTQIDKCFPKHTNSPYLALYKTTN